MSGIFGYFDPLRSVSASTLDGMARMLAAGGAGTITCERFEFGSFGIQCLPESGGIYRDSQAVSCAVHGRLVSRAEREVLASQQDLARPFYAADGPGSLANLRGSFSAVVFDARSESVSLFTDHFGSQPLYLCWHGGACYFASQLKAILAVAPGTPRIDNDSVATMLSFGEVLGNRTLVAGVETLPAATRLTLVQDRAETRHYWQYVYEEDRSSKWDESVERVGKALMLSVGRCVSRATTIAVPLSGGLDSRFVLDIACQHDVRATAYTWGVDGCRDLLYAHATAKRLGCPHEQFVFEPDYLERLAELGVWLTEGHTPATNFHVLPYVGKVSSAGHNCLLDGFAGDVVLGGNFISDAWLHESNVRTAAQAIWLWRRAGFDKLWSHGGLRHYRDRAESLFVDGFALYPGKSQMDRAMAFLIDNRLRRTTACGAELFRSRLPVWQPFMDVDFQDAIRTLPHQWRKRHRFYLAVLGKFAPISAAAPYQRTMLPASAPYWMNWFSLALQRGVDELFSRTRLGDPFPGRSPSDFPRWLRGPLREYVESVLLSEQTLDRGVIPADVVRSAVGEHMRKVRDLSALIGAMLTLELFCRLFLDDIIGSVARFGGHQQQTANAKD